MIQNPDYHDYVIRDGRFIGDFDGAYSASSDPWNQSAEEHVRDSRRIIAREWAKKINLSLNSQARAIEIGCGYGHLTNNLSTDGLQSLGTDISTIAIDKAKKLYPNDKFEVGKFNDWGISQSFQPDIFILSEISWYVLDEIKPWLENLRSYSLRSRPVYLIHLLAIYPDGVQKYGLEYFSGLKSILKYFDLDYLEYGEITNRPLLPTQDPRIGTYFVAQM